ncbi:BCL2/adenovirus E1B 19 kDa protein-interacting protein 2-like isoform X5 [Dunckerocampus dactyliophorus]|uniref:BCL2/adenovirus E1B 19 kDa protein-interacting protein 2-like isoform X5 n=1 Tax=Dunckerocampus dactyliophorus TaxID=161453 RepID=UPI0024051EC1|nr:BCL2/adenovirus E1B 19 kDa protein-interacting protein 2-like isoform X5 [Dunckerocampus dactyliophorus]XP_054620321.1 BCL2/adenovirus E1B 19 kDa protein-interacting protein 2-like isoform X5 [Dunckerocampus dactyliophorus]
MKHHQVTVSLCQRLPVPPPRRVCQKVRKTLHREGAASPRQRGTLTQQRKRSERKRRRKRTQVRRQCDEDSVRCQHVASASPLSLSSSWSSWRRRSGGGGVVQSGSRASQHPAADGILRREEEESPRGSAPQRVLRWHCDEGERVLSRRPLTRPSLSFSGRSESGDFHSAFLSLSPGDQDDGLDGGLDFDLDAMETPSDSESLRFPADDLDLEEDTRGGGVAASSRTGSLPDSEQGGLGALEREDMVDSQGTRWRSFSAGEPPQESRVNMSVLEPFLRVLSHGGYYGDGMNDIIVFSSCYLPENSLENYQYVMDNLFRYLVGTLDLMVTENYVIVYLCAGGQKDKLPGIGWLKECYQTIAWRLRKNLKGMYVVHPTWSIKTLITIIKPFISSKFSRKLRFISSLQELAALLPTEHVQIPDCVRLYDRSLSS